jgi:HK97 gp10 family phage protein
MAFVFDIGVEGEESLEGLELALRNMSISVNEEIHIAALKKAANVVRQRMDVTVPERTGEFARTLRVAKTKYKQLGEYQVIVGFKKGRGGNGKPLKGFIAHFLEYGTQDMPARPFMRRADSATREQQERIYTQEIQREVDRRLNGL